MALILDGSLGVPVTTVTGTLPVANGGTGVATSTGTGANALATSPTLTTPVLSGTVTGTYTLGGTPTISGTLTAGTSCVMNPMAANTVKVQAHGLGAIPHFTIDYFECLTAEQGYTAGDRISLGIFSIAANVGAQVGRDATNLTIVAWGTPYVLHKSTSTGAYVTLANWKYVSVPYKIN